MMDGIVVGTEKGRLILFKSKICPLVRSRASFDSNEEEEEEEEEEDSKEEYEEE